jgi:sodium-dependent dicarboxylate transporter 2/3/5
MAKKKPAEKRHEKPPSPLKELKRKHKLEEKEARKKERLEKRLEHVEGELEKIARGEPEKELATIERQKEEIKKLRDEVQKDAPTSNLKFIFALSSIVIFLAILAIPSEAIPGLTVMGQRALAIFILVFMLWITEAIPLAITALIPGALLVILGIRPEPAEAFKTYAHPAVFFVIGSLIIAHGLVQSGLTKRISYTLISKSKARPGRLMFMFIALAAIFSAFVSDHLMAALLIPVVVTIIMMTDLPSSFRTALLLSVAFGAGMGGLASPSGGARNVIALGLLEELTGQQIAYFEWMRAAFPLAITMIFVIWIVLRFVFPYGKVNLRPAMKEVEKHVKPLNFVQWKALIVFAVTIFLFIFTSNLIGLGTVAILGAILMFFAGALTWDEARKRITWGIMFVYGAAITMGIALMETGAAEWIAKNFLTIMPTNEPFALLFGVVVLSMILTNFMSDGAASSILAPISITLAVLAGFNPRLFAMATAIPCTFSFLTIFGTPPNLIAYETGYLRMRDLAKAGIIIAFIAVFVLYLLTKYYWPMIGFSMLA